jgi:serine/threonine protein kinase
MKNRLLEQQKMTSGQNSLHDQTVRESTPPLTQSSADGRYYDIATRSLEAMKTPKARRKSDIHELLPEMLSRHESEAYTFRHLRPGESIGDLYLLEEQVYAYGAKTVLRCTEIGSMKRFVMKRRLKEGYGSEVERHWRRVMEKLLRAEPNKHVVAIHEIVEDEEAFYIVMEECNGGPLLDLLLRESAMPAKELKRIVREILLAVEFLHDLGLIHRDIKPENIMLSNKNGESIIKLIDFDTCDEIVSRRLSIAVTPSEKSYRRRSTRIVGTLGYIAPESFSGEYSTASDLFSVGVVFWIIMTGDLPFDDSIYSSTTGKDDEDGDMELVGSPRSKRVMTSLKSATIDWNVSPWPQMPLARDLCQKLFEFDPDDRITTCREALSHPWFTKGTTTSN